MLWFGTVDWFPGIVIPAGAQRRAGIQGKQPERVPLDARFRGHDGIK